MGKKRNYDSNLSDGGSAEESEARPPAKAPRLDPNCGDDKYVVWLVVKPESISTAELAKVAFPRKANGGAPTVIETSSEADVVEPQHIECRFNRSTSRMFHVNWKDGAKKPNDIRPSAKIRGVVQVSRCTRIDGDFVVPDDDLFI